MVKKKYTGREDGQDYRTAVAARPGLMLAAKAELLKQVKPLTLNIYKQVEMYKNFKKFVPERYWNDPLYQEPSKETIRRVKVEKKTRQKVRGHLKNYKEAASWNMAMNRKIEDIAFDGGCKKKTIRMQNVRAAHTK